MKPRKIRVQRRNRSGEIEEVDRSSSLIRTSQKAKLVELVNKPPEVRKITKSENVLIASNHPIERSGIKNPQLICSNPGCGKTSKKMYEHRNSSRGRIVLCEDCDRTTERRSFGHLDFLDKSKHKRKNVK